VRCATLGCGMQRLQRREKQSTSLVLQQPLNQVHVSDFLDSFHDAKRHRKIVRRP
jgi:hypothetical protein